jgi:hypothetical protein
MEEASALSNNVGILARRMLGVVHAYFINIDRSDPLHQPLARRSPCYRATPPMKCILHVILEMR